MTLEFHPAVQQDFNAAIDYYVTAGGRHLADRFEAELRECLEAIKSGPRQHGFCQEAPRFGAFVCVAFRSSWCTGRRPMS